MLWLDPAVPFEESPTASGVPEVVTVSDDGTTVEVQATFPMFDADGNGLGDAQLAATAARTGDVEMIGPEPGKTNVNEKTTGFIEFLEGSGTLALPGFETFNVTCFGEVGEISVFRTNPRAFVSANSGVFLGCVWETETGVASFFSVDDTFGFFTDASLETADLELFTTASSGSIDLAGAEASFELIDAATGDAYSATASATFTPLGSLVRSTQLGATFKTTLKEQALTPTGTVEFSTGDSFVIDDEACDAVGFDNRSVTTAPQGNKHGKAPVNDGPEGAIPLQLGSRFNAMNTGATEEPELPILTCPEGIFDDFGRTLWYTIEGTGGPVTIDTAGSNIDTLIGVYVPTGGGFEEIACIDDVFFEPVGSTYQAALTIDTEEGVTYYVQIGGFRDPFAEEPQAEAGRMRISVR